MAEEVNYPSCVELVPGWKVKYCFHCCGDIKPTESYLQISVRLDGEEPVKRVMHRSHWDDGEFIVEGDYVVGWDCFCCSCPDDGPSSMTCRSHGLGYDGCEIHRQPARELDL